MELVNSNSEKKIQQINIFKRYASARNILSEGETISTTSSANKKNSGELVMFYDDFIELISNSKKLYSEFTDHSFNLNQVPSNTFGCIFFAIDESNKGYLTISDWFYFNNILEQENYHLILLYEFFRKFDRATINNYPEKIRSDSIDRSSLLKPINYSNKFLSFDELLLNVGQFKSTINLLHDSVNDEFSKKYNLFLDWDSFPFLNLYECFPFGRDLKNPDCSAYLTLNSLITIIQNDLKNRRLRRGFEKLCHRDPVKGNLVINKSQLMDLLSFYFSHKVSANIFLSLNLSNTSLLKSNNNAISYNVFKDIFYLFQNFDLLNQALLKYSVENGFTEEDMREHILTKRDFMRILNQQYYKVNNINDFSPSQINLLFSIVANSKRNSEINQEELEHHRDSKIQNYIQNEFQKGENISKKQLETFNDNYSASLEPFAQDTSFKKLSRASVNYFEQLVYGKRDQATMTSRLTIQDFLKILNPNYLNDVVHQLELRHTQNNSLYVNYYFYPIFDSLYNFCLGSVAGCIGATMVYPIDFVKTRMQAQRTLSKYKNSLDCVLKVIKQEGVRGLYSGLGFQLIGVAPEKAIKLTVNDYMRKKLVDKQGKLPMFSEIISGATAGLCQVIFTNPIEIVKIRLQVKSEYNSDVNLTARSIISKLGFSGLYRGVTACLMRDVPFSAIYFPTYAHLKKDIFNFDPMDKRKRNRLKTWELLVAGALAGMPAAFLTTPFDVIKTRLQIDARKGETSYSGIFHAAKTILKEESIRSFFKGGGARVLRSSPQFGFTLAAYELFKSVFPLPNLERGEQQNRDDHLVDPAEVPSITSHISAIVNKMKYYPSYSENYSSTHDFFNPAYNPYSSNYLNYYYKSCRIAKTFIDLDISFSKFDEKTFLRFHKALDDINKK
ncbi:mitochondrial aspartate-glutamate transporter Agc1p [Monosporozyma servazzii]